MTNKEDALGYYQILGVAASADESTIKLNYRDRAKHWHPDHNSSEEAKENFQKISVAYDVLSDEEKRLTYDLLCSAYESAKFPPMFSLKAYKNRQGKSDLNVRALSLWQVFGKILSYSKVKDDEVCNYNEALKITLKVSVSNWLLGWWSPKSLFVNAQVISANFKEINTNSKENYQLLVHNALAYYQDNNLDWAFMSVMQAGNYANSAQKKLLNRFLDKLGNHKTLPIKPWNYLNLKLIQLVFPFVLLIAGLIPFSVKVVSESDLLDYFAQKKEISYHQQVQFSSGETTSDDMVVGKIISIPVDKSDSSKLYHLSSAQKIMYGPADDFDVLKTAKRNVTVRLTGVSPDKIWARVMMDEGELGFVRLEYLQKGIGKEIPYGSTLVEKRNQ